MGGPRASNATRDRKFNVSPTDLTGIFKQEKIKHEKAAAPLTMKTMVKTRLHRLKGNPICMMKGVGRTRLQCQRSRVSVPGADRPT